MKQHNYTRSLLAMVAAMLMVVIQTPGNAVESILASEMGATGIYDLKGQRIGEKWENLPRGV
ncbi:MAG: hypothetical protein IJ197_04630 [Bacteroidaceae bacterium]|nr:hypothetical protein [Bacteroidaceae bacterium]